MRLKEIVAMMALVAASRSASAEAPFSLSGTPGKLPKDVIPVQYTAHLVPDIDSGVFQGFESVEIRVLKNTSKITLNADNLEIDSATLSGSQGGKLQLVPRLNMEQQTLSFQLARPLRPGRYRLTLAFRGHITGDGRGLFQMNYKAGGKNKKMLATQMQPTDARRVLPTWDEPVFRAKFKLAVDLPAHLNAYSNMPVAKRQKLRDGKQQISFATTPNMPSYLLVLTIGQLERLGGKQDGVDIGIVTTEGKLGDAAFPLVSTKQILHYYNSYFGIPYPLPKLDQIAIPGGFNGAMENWGGILYDESALLYSSARSPEEVKRFTFGVNAHEMAHQWFGNLVTMAWWDNLWLNEGFATWMATKATAKIHPEWQPYLTVVAERERVFDLDARASTHPIQTPIENEAQAANAFDRITYEKGQAFLRMLEDYLGEEAFRKGMRSYMARHQYSNTTSEDLWAALQRASGKAVRKLASSWTSQPGFPLITVSQTCVNGVRRAVLSQEQFSLAGPTVERRLWDVPLKIGSVGGKTSYVLLSDFGKTVSLPGCEKALVVDPDSVGFFRVQYDQASFDALAAQSAALPDSTRLKLLADTWSLVSVGRMPLARYVMLLSQYRNEPRLAVWQAILANLYALDNLADGEVEQREIRRFAVSLLKPKFTELGWTERQGEGNEDRSLRTELAVALARLGDEESIAHARMLFDHYLVDQASVSPPMVDFVLGTVGRYADSATYEKLTQRALKTENLEERKRLIRALESVKNPALAARTLKLALSPQLPINITSRIVAQVGRQHVELAWAFATEHREELLKNLDALERNRAFIDVMYESSKVANADLMEDYVRRNFGHDAFVAAQRVGAGIRIRAVQKTRLLPQVKAALE
jgi:aminopeptidase N